MTHMVAGSSFILPGGRFAPLTLVSYAIEYSSKPARNVNLSKMNGIIFLIPKKSNFRAKMFCVQSHKNKAGATFSSGMAVAEPVF